MQLEADLARMAQHRSFLNRYYGISRSFYDASRKYFLFGRDLALRELLAESWSTLIEVGPGTGRNLRLLRRRRPDAVYGGIEPCDAMREHARERAPWIKLVDAFAEDADYASVLGRPPDRILFSYCLSMVGDPRASLARAVGSLADGGEVVVVDFAGMGGLPRGARAAVRSFLEAFHVHPLDQGALGREPAAQRSGPFDYYVIARYRR
jgi:S-adenosylmethionine-diacylgycerolhomoserine-N-methlytransferase